MKIRKLLVATAFALPVLLCCSCVNNDYDLSDIDTTVRVRVDNLVVPLNLDAITLDKVISLGDNSQIKEVNDPVSGQKIYAALESGTFNSSEIKVPNFTVNKPSINKIASSISMKDIAPEPYDALNKLIDQLKAYGQYDANKEKDYEQQVWNEISSTLDGKVLCRYEFSTKATEIKSGAAKVDKAIRSIDNIGVDATFTIEFNINELSGVINVPVSNLVLQLPKGLFLTINHGTYDRTTGILDLSGEKLSITNGKIAFDGKNDKLTMSISSINPAEAGVKLTTQDNADGQVVFDSEVQVKSGVVEVSNSDFCSGKTFFDLPNTISYECVPDISAIKTTSFTGNIKYAITNMNIKPITLNNLPDILSGQETNIVLGNPQIYIRVSNPLYEYNVKAQTGFSLAGERNGVRRTEMSLDDGVITILKATNDYCLSPTQPSKYYGDYTGAEYAKFSNLSDILSGEGLPDAINVDVVNPCIPEQRISGFKLGDPIDKVHGEYTFFAPLDLDEGSVIVYEKTDKDWGDETLDKLIVEKLSVTATVTSDIPLGATATITPLDKNGNAISGVSFTSSKIEPNANGQEIEFVQTGGEIKGLDGISLRATIVGSGAEKAMQSVQKLDVKNLRTTVSGYYQDEL